MNKAAKNWKKIIKDAKSINNHYRVQLGKVTVCYYWTFPDNDMIQVEDLATNTLFVINLTRFGKKKVIKILAKLFGDPLEYAQTIASKLTTIMEQSSLD